MNLYEISDELDRAIEAEDGEYLTQLTIDFDRKVVGCGKVVKSLQVEAEAIQNEINRLRARKTALVNRRKWLIDYTTSAMRARKVDQCKDGAFKVSCRSKDKVVVVDIEQVPDDFVTLKRVASKSKILSAVKADGVIPEGVDIEENDFIVFT